MSLTPTEYDRGFNDGMASGLPRSALENANATIEALTAEITKLTSQLDEARAKAIEECAAIADERAAICADAVAKIKAGELYKETAKTSVQTENCARLEAVHIAELIRALLSESKS